MTVKAKPEWMTPTETGHNEGWHYYPNGPERQCRMCGTMTKTLERNPGDPRGEFYYECQNEGCDFAWWGSAE